VTEPVAGELVAVAEEAARAAGALLRERFEAGTERATATKSSPTDLVSEADHAAEAAIRATLAARRPDDAVVGEEGADVAGTSGLRWIVDPLDGTVNFLFGIPQWCVSIACDARAGVVYDPLRDELFAVEHGGPATLNGVAMTPSAQMELATALVATGFGYDVRVRKAQAAIAAEVIPRVRDIRRAGSAALDLAWTAAGRLDAFYERGVQQWDIAAGVLLCEGVGLHVESLPARDGLPAGVLAAPTGIAGELLELVG
jgi:myo-inositol-1(or 4)-monophosphatase